MEASSLLMYVFFFLSFTSLFLLHTKFRTCRNAETHTHYLCVCFFTCIYLCHVHLIVSSYIFTFWLSMDYRAEEVSDVAATGTHTEAKERKEKITASKKYTYSRLDTRIDRQEEPWWEENGEPERRGKGHALQRPSQTREKTGVGMTWRTKFCWCPFARIKHAPFSSLLLRQLYLLPFKKITTKRKNTKPFFFCDECIAYPFYTTLFQVFSFPFLPCPISRSSIPMVRNIETVSCKQFVHW